MFSMYNDGLYMRFSTVNINFDACIGDHCASGSQIEKFISDFSIQLWSKHEFIDFHKYNQRPTSKAQF